MVAFNYSTMQMTAKVVYYGPGLGGKTTNLQTIYHRTSAGSRGEMVLLETEGDRTLFFDLLPLEVGQVAGFRTRIQLYTVPGQVFYNTTRRLVLKGVDGIVFVADSQRPMLAADLESFHNLEANLKEMDIALDGFPLVLQYNKRDLPDVMSLEEMDGALNRGAWPRYEATAVSGEGVFETLKAIAKLTLLALRQRLTEGAPSARAVARPAPRRRLADALQELERIRRETLSGRDAPAVPGDPPALPVNGSRRVSRDISLSVSRAEIERARRLSLSLRLEGGSEGAHEVVNDLEVDAWGPEPIEKLLLRLSIALGPED